MSEGAPDRPYIYQPFGSVSDRAHAAAGRLWGIGGVSLLTTIKGLTKDEAQRVLDAFAQERDEVRDALVALMLVLDHDEPWDAEHTAEYTAAWSRARAALGHNASHAYAIAEPLGEGVTHISKPHTTTEEGE
jgi:hypothetical protein